MLISEKTLQCKEKEIGFTSREKDIYVFDWFKEEKWGGFCAINTIISFFVLFLLVAYLEFSEIMLAYYDDVHSNEDNLIKNS